MAQAAASLSELSSGRFVLGLGYSHKFVNEYVLGLQQGPPIGVMREYVDIVRRLTGTGEVNAEGRHFTAHAQYTDRRAMCRSTSRRSGPDDPSRRGARRGHRDLAVVPPIRPRAGDAGRARGLRGVRQGREGLHGPDDPAAYTGTDEAEQRSRWAKSAASYRMLPYYRHVLNAYGDPQPEEFSLIGPASRVRERLAEYREAGCVPVSSPMPGTDEDSSAPWRRPTGRRPEGRPEGRPLLGNATLPVDSGIV